MILNFTKMQGIGNDYIYIDCLKKEYKTIYKNIPKLCNRNFGIGSDGVILILPSNIADFKMRIFNSDGSEGEMCGNGIRCMGKYLYDKRIINKDEVYIETLSGVKKLKLYIENEAVKSVNVDMGKAIIDKDYIKKIKLKKELFDLRCVSIGNPHAVIFVDDLNKIKINELGPKIENASIFPNKTNVEFIQIIDDKNIKMRVWERGSGETLACGTGACASAVICIKEKYCKNDITVHLLGGKLQVKWNKRDNHIYMTGPAEFVFDGIIKI